MQEEKATLQQLLKNALSMEVEAAQLFFIATSKTDNKEARKILNSLSKEEEEHFFTILKIFNRVTEGIEYFIYSNIDRENAISKINGKIKAAGIGTESSIEDIVRFALKEEEETREYYLKCIEATSNVSTKRILKKLLNEENNHKHSLLRILNNYL